MGRAETAKRCEGEEYFQTLLTYKADWDRELSRRKKLGLTDLPEPLPHPDDILIDPREGTAYIRGPMTQGDKAQWDELAQRKAELEADLAKLRKRHTRSRTPEERGALDDEIGLLEEALGPLKELLGK